MAKRTNRKSKFTPGAAPGDIVHTGPERNHKVKLTHFSYNKSTLIEDADLVPNDLPKETISRDDLNSWINVDGVHDTEFIKAIGDQFALHPLVLEDIANTKERPKIEDFDNYLYFVMNMCDHRMEDGIIMEQVSIVLGKSFILSFQEDPDDIFDPIRKRLRMEGSRVRKHHSDYLAYLLLDAVVDRYFVILEHLGDRIAETEEILMDAPDKSTLQTIYFLKRELNKLSKAVWPMREIVGNLKRMDTPLVSKHNNAFLRDLHDHILSVIDTVENYRDSLSSMIDLYLSTTSNRMNETMKVLTVISTIFIPLTFITGFYGMNFEFMPELHTPWSYPLIIALMAVMVAGQLYYFRRKRWL